MKYDLTIIIPTFNSEKYIERCIKSVLNNNCRLQILVIDDGSYDNTNKILNKYDKYVEVINLKSNFGVSVVATSSCYLKTEIFCSV